MAKHGDGHLREWVNTGELIDSVDMMVHLLEQLDVEYLKTVRD
jgi:hypothetical protein